MAKCSEVLRALLRHGWYAERQSGSHVIIKHPEKEGFISFPNHGTAEMGKGLMKKILKQAGLKKL
ncbi:MAG: type II toxin-antitoxin system HicA family toxin [Cyclobacteriaceae bacterium]|nr:type II toxin-antitoxin system HicA family toxin [Cyclobacteriaceae bacterium]